MSMNTTALTAIRTIFIYMSFFIFGILSTLLLLVIITSASYLFLHLLIGLIPILPFFGYVIYKNLIIQCTRT